MFDRDKWKEIWSTITRNRTRSILTAFGVSWGVFMFIVLVGFGNGFKREMSSALDGFASNTIALFANPTGEPYKGHRNGRFWMMNLKDIDIIRHKVPQVAYISPWGSSYMPVVRGNMSEECDLVSVMTDYFRLFTPKILQGRVLNDLDMAESRRVCVIGSEIYERFFQAGEEPIGQTIRIGAGGMSFQVIGVVEATSMIQLGGDMKSSVFIPYTTLQRADDIGDRFFCMALCAQPGLKVSAIEQQVTDIIKENHDISPTDTKALWTFNAEEQLAMMDGVFGGVNLLLWVIGLGALFSGVIGISNIMLVTVRERMREIGVRRAIGAGPRTIVAQIMSESLVLTTLAGMAGFVVGSLLLIGIRAVTETGATSDGISIYPYISFDLALGAVAILVVSALLAGLMPAWKALRIKAIDAIRDE